VLKLENSTPHGAGRLSAKIIGAWRGIQGVAGKSLASLLQLVRSAYDCSRDLASAAGHQTRRDIFAVKHYKFYCRG